MDYKDEDITELFYSVYRWLEKQAKSGSGSVDPFSGQYKCLFILEKTGRVKQQRLAGILGIRATSLSELLSKLENKGYVLREPSADDRRTYFVSLTASGYEEVIRVRRLKMKEHRELTVPLTEEEKRQLFGILTKIRTYYASAEERQ